jgi:hypothetical protein
MFWEIEEIKKETKIIPLTVKLKDDKSNSSTNFSEWEEVRYDYFIESYVKRLKEIMIKISTQTIYYDESKDFKILKKPNINISEDFAFIYGNLVFIRKSFEFIDFFVIHDNSTTNHTYIRPYGYKHYLFGVHCFLNTHITDISPYFTFNNLTLKSFDKYSKSNVIIFDCIDDYTFKTVRLSFSFDDFDFDDLDNPNKIYKFKFE